MADQYVLDKSPRMTPGAQMTPINPAFGAAGRFPGQRPQQNMGGTDGRANIVGNGAQPPTIYERTAPPQPPNVISDVNIDRNWFTPLQPVAPFGPPYVNSTRVFDYNVGFNIDFLPARVTLFGMLRTMAQSWGVLATVIEKRKDQLLRMPWKIVNKADPKIETPHCKELTEFFKKPDRINRFDPWMKMLLHDLFIIDAPALHVWRSLGSTPYAIEILDGATIKPLIDDAGRRPAFPNPAFQQIIKGLPMVNLTDQELIYSPSRPRPFMPVYGYSPVEQIMMEVLQGIRKTIYATKYWDEGTIPDLIITVPEAWTPNQIAAFQAMFDAMMSGNLAFKSKVRFMPGGMKPFDLKGANGEALKTDQDEWLTRIVCFAFDISPQPFVREMNRATAETAEESAAKHGLFPLMKWVKDAIMNPLIQEEIGFNYPDVEFVWQDEPEIDEEKRMKVNTGYTNNAVMTINEARETMKLKPITGGDELIVNSRMGPVPLVEAIEAARASAKHTAENPGLAHGVGPDGQPLPRPLDPNQRDDEEDDDNNPPRGAKKKPGVGQKAAIPFFFKRGRKYRRAAAPMPTRREAQIARKEARAQIAVILGQLSESVQRQLRAQAAKEAVAKAEKKTPAQRAMEIVAQLDLSELFGVIGAIDPALKAIATDAAFYAIAAVGLEKDEKIVDVVNERAVAIARDRAAELVGMRYNEQGKLVQAARAEFRIDETTRDMLRTVIADGLERNIGLDKIADDIGSTFAFSHARADTIAYTEVMRANSEASLESYKVAQDAGVEILKEWLNGPKPCPICIANEQEGPIELSKDFSSGDETPPAHPNCECALAPVLAEDDLKAYAQATGFTCEVIERGAEIDKAVKISKRQAKYVDKSRKPEHCEVCTMFRAGRASAGSCTAVMGAISPNAYCKMFDPKG